MHVLRKCCLSAAWEHVIYPIQWLGSKGFHQGRFMQLQCFTTSVSPNSSPWDLKITCLAPFFLPEAAYLSQAGVLWQPNYILKKFPMKEFHHFQLTPGSCKMPQSSKSALCWLSLGEGYRQDTHRGLEEAEKATDNLWDRPCPIYGFFMTLLPDLLPLALHRANLS